MNNLQNIVYKTGKGTPVTDSVKVAGYLGRRHSNITKSIRRIMSRTDEAMFYETRYVQYGTHPLFIMNRRGFIELTRTIPGISSQVSMILRMFDDADGNGAEHAENGAGFTEPECDGKDIVSPPDLAPRAAETDHGIERSEEETMAYIIMRIDALIKAHDEINAKLEAIMDAVNGRRCQDAQKPPTTIRITSELVSVGELAKMLCQYGIPTGEMRLFQWLRDKQFLCAAGSEYNLPRQKFIEQGLFVIRASRVQLPTGQIVEKNTTKVTAKGQEYFIRRFLYNKERGTV
jgi:anti-repressor protein